MINKTRVRIKTDKWCSRLVWVTPEMALRWLTFYNAFNRKISPPTVAVYVRDILAGKWKLNTASIGFATDGNILDGQHRLWAIWRSKVAVEVEIVTGLERSAQETVDRNRVRSVSDTFAIRGIKSPDIVTSSLVLIGQISMRRTVMKLSAYTAMGIYNIYKSEFELILEERQWIPGLSVAPVIGAMVFAAKSYPDEVVEFARGYFTGENLSKGNPILVFRKFMSVSENIKHVRIVASRLSLADRCLNAMMGFVNQDKVKKVSSSNLGYEFFAGKQMRAIDTIKKLLNIPSLGVHTQEKEQGQVKQEIKQAREDRGQRAAELQFYPSGGKKKQ